MATSRWRACVALSGLGRLQNPEADARRLFLAEALLDAGMAPDELLKVVTTRPTGGDFAKYSPDQPRVPAGNGRPSGRWTSSGATPGAPARTPTRARSRGRASPHLPLGAQIQAALLLPRSLARRALVRPLAT